MKISLITILVLVFNVSFSQTIEELEFQLTLSGDKKDKAYQLLEIDSFNTEAINYLVRFFGRKKQRDSVFILFDTFIKNNVNNPKPYLIIAQERYAHHAGLNITERINYLKKAKKIDENNTIATYMLGEIYYKQFIKEYKNNKEKAKLDHYVNNATNYFEDLCLIDEKYMETVKYPLIQLAEYVGDHRKSKELKLYNCQFNYFPIAAFAGLPKNWETNYTVNVFVYVADSDTENIFYVSGIEPALRSINWYSKHLKALEEPVLSDTLPTKIFRFTWLRTFHNPIVIGIENLNDSISLYWKVSDRAGGYEPGKIIEHERKLLTQNEWNAFTIEINGLNYWNLPSAYHGLSGKDGAQWILEGKELGKYHVVDRWLGREIEELCLELLGLTNLKIKKKDIY